MSLHTPGPWEYIDATTEAKYQFAPSCIIRAGQKQIASFSWNDQSPWFPSKIESQANARLIAASPDLLSAARRVADWIEREAIPYLIDSDDNPGQAMRAAIAKAEGRTS